MAKLKGILKIEGTLQDMTFYKTQDGHLVKTKSGVSADRIANDPAFARTRENGTEFANAVKQYWGLSFINPILLIQRPAL
jgi:hypothetical protein